MTLAGSEPRIILSERATRLSEHVVAYDNGSSIQIIVQVVGTSRPDTLENLASEIIDAASWLRSKNGGAS